MYNTTLTFSTSETCEAHAGARAMALGYSGPVAMAYTLDLGHSGLLSLHFGYRARIN